MADIRGVLIDIDGVLTVSWQPIPGAVEALRRLREHKRILLVTNTSSRTRVEICRALTEAGFAITLDEIVTAPVAAAGYLAQHHPGARCLLLNSGDITKDLPGIRLVDDDPDVVVLGGAGPEFGYETLDRVFGYLQRGVPLIAMHRNLFWRTDKGLRLDTGAFLAGLEQAANTEAVIVGKPTAEFFSSALAKLGVSPEAAVMVGDDIESDVLAAQHNGITGVLVRTGKYTRATHEAATGEPDHVLDSFAELPELLGI